MPQCYRCERIQPTAELRRTTRGFLCKDNDRFSRCAKIVKERKAAERAGGRS